MPIIVTNGPPAWAFVQPHDNDFPGPGIGHAVKRIAGWNGGRVWTQCRVGEGATCHAAIPQGGGDHV
jgi:light-regulated signal transduction histidine kinase (bacteriophytochrome)